MLNINHNLENNSSQEELRLASQKTEKSHSYRTKILKDIQKTFSPNAFLQLRAFESFFDQVEKNLHAESGSHDEKPDAEKVHHAVMDAVNQHVQLVNLVSLVRERPSESSIWSDFFWIDAKREPNKELFTAAVHAYLSTDKGKKAIEETCHDFNWGDALIYVPEETWNQFGIYSFQSDMISHSMGDSFTILIPDSLDSRMILVDQDEILIPESSLDFSSELQNKTPLAQQILNANSKTELHCPSKGEKLNENPERI